MIYMNSNNIWALHPEEETMIIKFKDRSVVAIGLDSNNIEIVDYGNDNDLALMCIKNDSPDFVSFESDIWNHINDKLGGVLE